MPLQREQPMTGDHDEATQELLEALDVLYPLPDDARRVERAGRTAYVLKQWMASREAELLTMIPKAIARFQINGS